MIRVYLREHNISKLDEIQLLSVVDELTTNAVEHAYSDSQGEIEVVLNYYNNTIFLTVEDFGRGFDESLDSKEDGGFGLSIARKLVDLFEIEKKRKGTIIKVEKKINSLAMGILRGKLQTVREMGGDIKIVNLNKHIQTIFETIGLDEIFEIYKNEEEALKSFK